MFGPVDAARLARPLTGDGAVVTADGSGWDHDAWRVRAADGTVWIVRVARLDDPSDDDVGDARREVAVMQLARRHVGDLVADAVVLDQTLGRIAYRRVPGVPLQDLVATGAVAEPVLARLAGEIGALVAAVGAIDPTTASEPIPVDDDRFDAWFADLPSFVDEVEHLLAPHERSAVDRFLAAPPPPDARRDELVLAHNDLGGEHLLVDPTTFAISGIIDWSDAAIADPAAELGRLLRDLGPAHLDAVLDGLGASDVGRRATLTERAWCYARCLVLEDLAYAVRRRPDLVAYERASLGRLFAGM
jgi:aminoglycoside phosphotransferase (APT) family kinase protein